MKFIRNLFWLLAVWSMTVVSVFANTFIPYGTPKIDGQLNTGEWPELSHIRMARFYGFDQFADLWFQWDDTNLYIAGKLQDYTLYEDGRGNNPPFTVETWQDDSIEIALHPTASPTTTLNELSRILAFTISGKYHRLDRGKWQGDPSTTAKTTGLETLKNTTQKLSDEPFFNKPIPKSWDCPREQPAPATEADTVINHNFSINSGFQGWQFEIALPWRVVGTRIGKKVVAAGCGLGDGVFPEKLVPSDGLALQMNFYRINDDNGGDVTPKFAGEMSDALNNKTPDGIMMDEWFVYQGDRYRPNEWATFVLSDQRRADVPQFNAKTLESRVIDGKRVRLKFQAAQRANGGSAYRYLVRFQEGGGVVDETRWNNMQVFEQAYFPTAADTWQEIEVINLTPGKGYTFALRAIDERGQMSKDILSTSATTLNDNRTFITVAPTGRNLVLSDGRPFVVVGETGLMPWLPLRGLYDGILCDEQPPQDSFFLQGRKECGIGKTNKQGKSINGRERNYFNEDIFYTCYLANDKTVGVSNIPDGQAGVVDNCQTVAGGHKVVNIEPVEGPKVAENYFAKLNKAGINVLTVFVESLDLDASPIFFEEEPGQYNQAVFRFLDRLLELARKNDVYLLLRLYDDFYYRDDRFGKGDFRKWTDTYWYRKLGKQNPENFFDEDIYDYHKNRMVALFNKYRDEPYILGWDLLNEADNGVRFNQASYEKRKKWLEEMLRFAQERDEKHLIFYSFLAWEPKDDDENYRNNSKLGMDARLAYQVSGSDLALPHAYYAHVANPWDAGATNDYSPVAELARGITYGFHQIRDGRPILDGESSPNVHLYGKHYDGNFTEAKDDEAFMDGSWVHFASGGAGANLRWPADLKAGASTINQINDTKRSFLKVFKEHVGNLAWRGDQLLINNRKLDNVIAFSRDDGYNSLIYLYNQFHRELKNDDFNFAEIPIGKAAVKIINPRTGATIYERPRDSTQAIALDKRVNESVAIIITGMEGRKQQQATPSDGTLITSDLWIKGVIHTVEKGAIQAVWKLGGDSKTARGDRVIWGHFYANPADVGWGSENNPDLFAKIWFDVGGRVDINFFHVSVPDIEMYSCMNSVQNCQPQIHRSTMNQRYIRHSYKPSENFQEAELLNTPEMTATTANGNPRHYTLPVQSIDIGSIIQLDGGSSIDGVWNQGGTGNTSRGDQVVWGYFYADPKDVSWGNQNNPEVYVKLWFDNVAKRTDVNFFHVSVPNIKVYSGRSSYSQETQITIGNRYTRHEYR